jgi:hypothetical protein
LQEPDTRIGDDRGHDLGQVRRHEDQGAGVIDQTVDDRQRRLGGVVHVGSPERLIQ